MRRRVTRRPTRLQTMRNVLKYGYKMFKKLGTVAVRFCVFFQLNYVQYCNNEVRDLFYTVINHRKHDQLLELIKTQF